MKLIFGAGSDLSVLLFSLAPLTSCRLIQLSRSNSVHPYLVVSLVWDILQDDRLHGEDVGELHLGDVECAHDVGPAWLEERLAADQRHDKTRNDSSGNAHSVMPSGRVSGNVMIFTSAVCPLEGAIFVGTQLTPLRRHGRERSLLEWISVWPWLQTLGQIQETVGQSIRCSSKLT